MSGKGLLVIVFMGIAGLAAFGLLANWLVDNNPVIQSLLAYRAAVAEDYPCADVTFGHDGGDYRLRLEVDEGELPAPIASAGRLPPPFDGLPRHFATRFSDRRSPRSLEVVLVREPGWGCAGDDTVLCRQSFPLDEQLQELKRRAAAAAGVPLVRLLYPDPDTLEAQFLGHVEPEAAEKVARLLGDHLGGGWHEVRLGTNRGPLRFDGRGKRLAP